MSISKVFLLVGTLGIAGCQVQSATPTSTSSISGGQVQRTLGYNSDRRFMREYGLTAAPAGYLDYCRRNPQECQPKKIKAQTVTMSKQRWGELNEINLFANRTVIPVTDQELYKRAEYWTLPGQYGDCEDYVLLKRKMLIEKGWPESALLITVLRDERQAGHAVLTVATDQGDLILDNRKELISAWSDTPYTYYLRQSRTNPTQWMALRPSTLALGPKTTNN